MLKFQCKIVGTTPLIMHRGGMADPLDPFTKAIKAISKKRAKTEADFEQMAKLEFLGGLYTKDGKIIIPRGVFKAALREAGKKFKRGKDIVKGIRIQEDFPLIYPKLDKPEKLWKRKELRFSCPVRVQQAKIMRMRPMFPEWSANIEFYFDETIFNQDEVKAIIEECGISCFLMEWRGEFGGFEIQS